ncbi:MAG TPA: hypothetical protein PK006_12040 [Saprospiraceae bacterium]|nr:hypothetical protein [Saprospiraceae bacterium]
MLKTIVKTAFLILSFQELYSQCLVSGALTCEQATKICNLNDINFSQCTNSTTPNQAGLTSLCPQGGKIENALWWSFFIYQPELKFNLVIDQCSSNLGLQLAIYEDCPAKTAVLCKTLCLGPGIHQFTLQDLSPCKEYFLLIDGCFSDLCSFAITTDQIILPNLDSIKISSGTSSDTVCRFNDLELSLDHSPANCSAHYQWTANQKTVSTNPVCLFSPQDTGWIRICCEYSIGTNDQSTVCANKKICARYYIKNLEQELLPDSLICTSTFPLFIGTDTLYSPGKYILRSYTILDSTSCPKEWIQNIHLYQSLDTLTSYLIKCEPDVSDSVSERILKRIDSNTCEYWEKQKIIILKNAIPNFFPNSLSICKQDTVNVPINPKSILASLHPSDTLSVSWRNPKNPNYTKNILFDTNGWYIAEIKWKNQCSFIDSVYLYINENAIPVLIDGPTKICPRQNYILTVLNQAKEYNWNTAAKSKEIVIQRGGNYCVTVTDEKDCKGSSCWFVSEYNLPKLEIIADTIFCSGTKLILSATPGHKNYKWNHDTIDSDQVIIDKGGTYCVAVKNDNDCSAEECINIHQKNSPTLYRKDSICQGDSLYFNFFYLTEPGEYSFKFKAANSCDSLIYIDLQYFEKTMLDTLLVTPQADGYLLCPKLKGGHSPFRFFWPNGENGPCFFVKSSGTYKLHLIDEKMCSYSIDIPFIISNTVKVQKVDCLMPFTQALKLNEWQNSLTINGLKNVQIFNYQGLKISSHQWSELACGVYFISAFCELNNTYVTNKLILVN